MKSRLKLLFRERDRLHVSLEIVDIDTRRINALKILDISDSIDEIYEKLAYFNEHGNLPVQHIKKEQQINIADLDKAGLIIALQNIRSNCSKAQRLMKSAKSTELYQKYSEKFEKLNQQKTEIENKLKKL